MAPVLISAAVEIAASPDVFLDFSTIHLYHHPPGLMKSLTPLGGAQGKTGMELQEGDWVKIVAGNNVVTPMILEETVVGLFAWVCRFAVVQNMMRKEFEVLNPNLKLWVESRTTGSTQGLTSS
ncbi:hypothetical protein HYALB_00004357 [Hymenoscyphus albidus]|uniref:Uncharacterized protein n=1 Tax=Hymenoscyphus albidus TaxID=595503 RepID=A0A9N9LL46_9HELO|nr:hypothetical protein HYALB_00004357 [Hymenoscyphus albidus]